MRLGFVRDVSADGKVDMDDCRVCVTLAHSLCGRTHAVA
jgi:hypothetical protein